MSEDKFILSGGQSHELEMAMNRGENGVWTPALVHLLTKGDTLGLVRQVLLGHASISVVEHLIDCDADPFNPWSKDGWTVEEHQKSGTFKWDSSQVELYLSRDQTSHQCIEGHKLRRKLAKKLVLNANVLDSLLANPHFIPKEWKANHVFFWGTVYRNRDGYQCVRFLYWDRDRWNWSSYWLGNGWYGHSPAAVRTT
jgi:hypothetical protein